jgi:lipopolysaccharide transport system ATP-binding protein
MAATAIKAEELGKSYQLGLHQNGNLRETLDGMFRHPVKQMKTRRNRKVDILWALRGLNFDIEHGEVVGLIGHNGAGKSTLLKVLSRITEPSSGYAEITGRVGSLLEVGTGFHPELTGRENIFLNGSILGMRRAEIRSRFDEIVEFSEIERFLDTPVKRYSSGMSVRLAFSVAAHLEPEILLIDEVLAVGDASFQRRSMTKMTEVAQEGRTVIFVSHNMGTIRTLCKRGILLEKGQVVADTDAEGAIDQYLQLLERASADDLLERTDRDSSARGEVRISKLYASDLTSGQRDVLIGGRPARITLEVTEIMPEMDCSLKIVNSLGLTVTRLDSSVSSPADSRDPAMGPVIECTIDPLPLMPGRYRIDARINSGELVLDGLEGAAYFDVEPGMVEGRPMHSLSDNGDVVIPHSWRLPSYGQRG